MLPSPPGADILCDEMPGSNAEDIVGDFFESDEWGELADADADPDLELPPQPPPEAA
jgi:hypothetical protein